MEGRHMTFISLLKNHREATPIQEWMTNNDGVLLVPEVGSETETQSETEYWVVNDKVLRGKGGLEAVKNAAMALRDIGNDHI
jgi:hypothetical protein